MAIFATSKALYSAAMVFIDSEIQKKLPALDLSRIKRELECNEVVVEFFEKKIKEERFKPSQALILGVCKETPKIIANAQKHGYDPFGIQVIELDVCCSVDMDSITDRAILILQAAIAKALAFSGAKPENKKSKIIPKAQKLSRRDFFSLPQLEYFSIPTIEKHCKTSSGCEQCLRSCPHKAIYKEEDAIFIDREKCTGCGICLVGCPWQAIYLPKWSYREITAQISTYTTHGNLASRPLLFVCDNALLKQMPGWLPVYVPCQAFVTISLILQSLYYGASEIGIYSCGEKCTTGRKNLVEQRIDYCRELLTKLNISRDRVKFVTAQDGIIAPASKCEPLTNKAKIPLQLFHENVHSKAIQNLLESQQSENLAFEHPASPLGVIEINAQACTCCGTCTKVCPTNALHYQEEAQIQLKFTPSSCINCGCCITVCPEQKNNAISLYPRTDTALITQKSQLLCQDQEVHCKNCGTPFATEKMLEKIKDILGNQFISPMADLCSHCRGQSQEPLSC